MAKNKGLENEFEEAKVGDFLYLQAKNGDKIAGYVRSINTKKVRISHESPKNIKKYGTKLFSKIFSGVKEYPLKSFDDYRILGFVDLTNLRDQSYLFDERKSTRKPSKKRNSTYNKTDEISAKIELLDAFFAGSDKKGTMNRGA